MYYESTKLANVIVELVGPLSKPVPSQPHVNDANRKRFPHRRELTYMSEYPVSRDGHAQVHRCPRTSDLCW